MLGKNGLQYYLNLLIIIILLSGAASSKNSFINFENSTQSCENEIIYDKEIIEDLSQEAEEELSFAHGLEFRNTFFTSIYHTYKLDDLLYICTNKGIMIYNCENMSNIIFVDILFPNVRISKFEMIEPNISIIWKGNSLFIYNITNLKSPDLIFEFLYENIYWYEIKNDILIFYLHRWGFYFFDISNLEYPIEVNFESNRLLYYYKIFLDNNTLIFADRNLCDIYFYDVSDIENIELKTVFHDDTSTSYDWDGMIAKDNILIIEKSNIITIYSYENIANIETLSTIETVYYGIIAFENEHLYLEKNTEQGKIISYYNLTDPQFPVITGESDPFDFYYYYDPIDIHDNFLFLCSNYNVIYIFNITNSNNFDIVSAIIGGQISSICHYQNFLYANRKYTNAIQIFDTSNPFTPYLTKSLLLNHTTNKMAIIDNYLIVSTTTGPEFYIYNISNPLQPTLILIHTLDYGYYTIRNFEIKNNLIFVQIIEEFLILDIEIITSPTEIFHLSLSQSITIFATSNELIAIYSGLSNSIFLYNYSDKQDIKLISEIYTGSLYYSDEIVITGNLLIYNYHFRTIKFYDISDPANPTFLFDLSNYDSIRHFAVLDNYLFLVEGYNTFKVYKIDTNYSPVLCYTENIIEYIFDVMFADEEIIYYGLEVGIISFGKDTDFDQLIDHYEEEIFNTNKAHPDTDNDDMTDYFEAYYNLNPLNSSDRDLDFDFDNLSNFEESLQFSDPYKIDTDSDNLSDFDEFNYLTNPILSDSDSDNLDDYDEIFLHSTNPLINDTDQDKLLDGTEILSSFTNPLTNDTDMDEMDDWWEYVYLLNPNDPQDKFTDLDLDGLLNFEEYLLGTYPHSSDSDNDNFSDKTEIEMGTDPMDPDDYPKEMQGQSSINFTFLLTIFLCTLTILNRFRKNRRRER